MAQRRRFEKKKNNQYATLTSRANADAKLESKNYSLLFQNDIKKLIMKIHYESKMLLGYTR